MQFLARCQQFSLIQENKAGRMKGGVCRSIERYREFFFHLIFLLCSEIRNDQDHHFLIPALSMDSIRCWALWMWWDARTKRAKRVSRGLAIAATACHGRNNTLHLHWRWCEPVTAPESNVQTLQISNIDQQINIGSLDTLDILRYLYNSLQSVYMRCSMTLQEVSL